MAKRKKKIDKIETSKPFDKVKYGKLKSCVQCLERDLGGTPKVLDNLDITFEYIVGSLFPDVLDNINEELSKQYIKGFNDRLKIGNIDDKTLVYYPMLDMLNAISSLSSIIRREDISENDKKELKNLYEILGQLTDNINKVTKE